MGHIYVDLTIANIDDRNRQRELSFLVDTGATRAWIPEEVAEDLGIEEVGIIALELADGTVSALTVRVGSHMTERSWLGTP